MKVHLVDGTYELFRHFYGAPSHRNEAAEEVAAVRGVVSSVLQLMEDGATHVGVATDHVIESFRNDLWPSYKTGEGVDPDLWSQAWPLEDALRALGVHVWAMVELEADDTLASAAAVAADDPAVEQVVICTPDKDLGQCVSGRHVVQLDRRKDQLVDEDGVRAKFGVGPESIADYLSLVGDERGRLPRIAGMGVEVGRHRAGPLGPRGGDPAGRRGLGGRGPWRGQAGGDPARPWGRGGTLQAPGHLVRRPLPADSGRGTALGGADEPVLRSVCRAGRTRRAPAGARSVCRTLIPSRRDRRLRTCRFPASPSMPASP